MVIGCEIPSRGLGFRSGAPGAAGGQIDLDRGGVLTIGHGFHELCQLFEAREAPVLESRQ